MSHVSVRGQTGAVALLLLTSSLFAATPQTFCNPLNLDYGLRVKGSAPLHRHGADPVVVLFNDRYYLFSTWDKPGYRVSDDLVDWNYIPFEPSELSARTYTAAAVIVLDGWMIYTEYGNEKQPASLWRTRDPDSGKWEKVRDGLLYRDPCLFVDPPSGKLFMYSGLELPIHGVELDRTTFAEIPGTDTPLMPEVDKTHIVDGWEICTWDNSEKSRPMRGNKTFVPCREGSWMTLLNGKYYLQFASPGTTVPGYSDGLLTATSPLGPFEASPYSPISRKDSGFITSAGHSCLFQDRYGNWWRAVTMLIGVNERMERRIGLFPAGFDADGVPYTRTELGDTPITLPDRPRDHLSDEEISAGWWVLSRGANVSTSSTLDESHNAPELAADEDVRSWWSAKSGRAGEWLQLDLGAERTIRAVQINLAEQDCQPVPSSQEPDAHRFVLRASSDKKTWTRAVDRADGDVASPHTYVAFDPPLSARYLNLENVFMPAGGKFAVSDLRVFGVEPGDPPVAVTGLTAQRDANDRRKVTLSWKPSAGASGYLIRYGIAPWKLYQHRLINGGDASGATLFCLNHDPPYTFVVDALNSSGRTRGDARATAP